MRQALEMALEALETAWYHVGTFCPTDEAIELYDDARAAIKEALAQPEQEPVASYVYKPTLPRGHLGNVTDGDLPWVYDQDPSSGYSARMLVHTTPPQRPWVGLTYEDQEEIVLSAHSIRDAINKTDQKLKEKNT